MKTITLLLLTLLAAAKLTAQDTFTITWSTIGSGGGPSAGAAEFTFAGYSVGQFAAGDSAGGPPGEFDITGGYWAFEFMPPPADLNLTMQLSGGMVTLTWDEPATPVVLESSANLDLWAPVAPQPATPFFQEPGSARRFYRLVPAD